MKRNDDYNINFALGLSSLAHVALALIVWLTMIPRWDELQDQIIYSVSVDGGSVLGGISQVETKSDTKVVPVKQVSTKEEQPEIQQVKLKEEKVETKPEKIEPEEDAEISIATPTPKPVVATPQPTSVPTTAPTKTPTGKPTAKATTTPVKKPTAKAPPSIDSQYQQSIQNYLGESTNARGRGFGAASSTGKGMGGGVVKPKEFFEYSQIIQRLIKNAWAWPDRESSLVNVVNLKILRDGTVEDVHIVRGSGNSEFDNTVVRAVLKVRKFPPPPPIVYEDFKNVDVEFKPRDF